MKNLRQNGTAVMTLSDLVDDFCLAQNNLRQSTILAQYRHARWSWKELFRNTLWEIKKVVLNVDCKDHTIRLPDDCESNKVLQISVVDCYGKLHPLGFNTDWNTAKINCVKTSCSCDNCKGEHTLCGAIDSLQVATETVDIQGTDYTKTIITRYDGKGAIQVEEDVPTLDSQTDQVVFMKNVKTICNVEVTDHGCIKATQPNMDLLRTYCGCGNFLDNWSLWNYGNNAYRQLVPATYNYWGEWNYNAADNQIIHIFGTGRSSIINHFNHTPEQETAWRGSIRQVIVDYQTNGETPGTEIMIPEYAVEAVQIGMAYRQKYLNIRISENDKLMAKNAWIAARVNIVKYLNPIQMENIAKLQTNKRLW